MFQSLSDMIIMRSAVVIDLTLCPPLRKVGMYLAKELCDLKLKEIAEQFGVGSYGVVGWACHEVVSRMQADPKFLDHVNSIKRSCQPKI